MIIFENCIITNSMYKLINIPMTLTLYMSETMVMDEHQRFRTCNTNNRHTSNGCCSCWSRPRNSDDCPCRPEEARMRPPESHPKTKRPTRGPPHISSCFVSMPMEIIFRHRAFFVNLLALLCDQQSTEISCSNWCLGRCD